MLSHRGISISLIKNLSQVMKNHRRELPKAVLDRYVKEFLDQKEIFLLSVKQFGTPQYFYDQPALDAYITKFEETFSKHFENFQVFYAMKSNPFPGICRRAIGSGIGLDVSSGLELSQALSLNCSKIIFSGPGKTEEELSLAIRNADNVTLLLDSFAELEKVARLVTEFSPSVPLKVGVRVNASQQGNWNKFGIFLKDLPAMFAKIRAVEMLKPCGIQFHTSWNLTPAAQIEMIERIGGAIRDRLAPEFQREIRFLDIGGGYWPETGEWLNPENTFVGKLIRLLDPEHQFSPTLYYHKSSPLGEFARQIAAAVSRQGPPLDHAEIWLEPGRWLSNSAMHILVKVLDKKDSRTVITDGGIHLLGWERPLSEFVPVINLSRPAIKRTACRIFGSLCTPLDIWGEHFFGDDIEVGDILLLPDQGAYTYSLRQQFIKPVAQVIKYNGTSLKVITE